MHIIFGLNPWFTCNDRVKNSPKGFNTTDDDDERVITNDQHRSDCGGKGLQRLVCAGVVRNVSGDDLAVLFSVP